MKNKILSFLFLALTLPCLSFAQDFVNLTPVPKTMTTSTGKLVLPNNFVVNTSGLSTEMAAEAQRFIVAFNTATNYQATAKEDANALIKITPNSGLGEEAYKIKVTTSGVTIEAKTPRGLYFAFQSIKKVLPANVMAGVKDATVAEYALPIIEVDDAPRFGYRGFMLDTSRHFFSVDELKRVLDVMSYYKMNAFHWHITDDQGWRIEIKKYPKLTTVGSISDNSYMVDMKEGAYWLNQPYGPHFYSQEDVKAVVKYAQERHIEVIPEIDMPGHFSAAMASYPEYSCNPSGSHKVVSGVGGVHTDILNVANPAAVQFAKDILTEVMDLFPSKRIHIGGDECPTTAWENNAECIAKKNELGLTSFRELQSLFIKEMTDHLKTRGREVSVWNEAITANGTDLETMKQTGAMVYCWQDADVAANKAQGLGLPHIYTPQQPWYINQKQFNDPNEPPAAGGGGNNLENVYKQGIPTTSHLVGVQGTFWSEYVAFGDYLEYLMLPRLVAIAEAGWSPQDKRNFDNFCQRITADAKLYDYNHYEYGKHYLVKANDPNQKVMPEVSTPTQKHWYRLVNRMGGDRLNRCIELLSSAAATQMNNDNTYKNKGAQENRIWTLPQKNEDDAAINYQLWSLEENPYNKGHYALVCKALPNGSINGNLDGAEFSGRWNYSPNEKHYNFILGDKGYGQAGDNYYYSIRSDKNSSYWMNTAGKGQGYALNFWALNNDQDAGMFTFVPTKVMPLSSTSATPYWYRLTTRASGDRQNKCIELLSNEAAKSMNTTYPNKGAAENILWTNAPATASAANFNAQYWRLEEDPATPGKFALICKAQPNGSVNPSPSKDTGDGRWSYDIANKHYDFILGDNGYGKEGELYYYSIRSQKLNGKWLNASLNGQGYAVNPYEDPANGNSGLWKFSLLENPNAELSIDELLAEAKPYLAKVKTYATPADKRPGYFSTETTTALQNLVNTDLSTKTTQELAQFQKDLNTAYQNFWASFGYLEQGKIYNLVNAVEGFNKVAIYDNLYALNNTTNVWVDDAWKMTASTINADHSQTVKLQNVQTNKFIGALGKSIERLGFPVSVADAGADIVCTFNPEHQDFVLSINGKNIYPVLNDATAYPNAVFAGSTVENGNAIRRQGAAWNFVVSTVKTFVCVDQQGKDLGTYRRSWPIGVDEAGLTAPTIENHQFVETQQGKSIYKRISCTITRENRDQYGALISHEVVKLQNDQTYTISLNVPSYYTLVKSDYTDGQVITPTTDMTITATFSHKGLNGVKKLGELVKEVKADHSYIFYDKSPDNPGRKGYRKANADKSVNRSLEIEGADPYHTWFLEASGDKFKVKNMKHQLYIPSLPRGGAVNLSQTGDDFTFSLNANQEDWKIKGSNNQCWDGNEDGTFVGWDDPGHPIAIYEYYVEPYFKVKVEYVDAQDNEVSEPVETLVKAGETFTVDEKAVAGYTIKEVQGATGTNAVVDNLNIKVVYQHVYNVTTSESANLTGRALATFSAATTTVADATDVEVYYAASKTAEQVVLKKIEPQNGKVIIPANMGVVLSTPAAKTFKMNETAEAAITAPSGNLLVGTGDAAKNVEAGVQAYILSKKADNNILFYLLEETDRTIAANHAYLVVTGAQTTMLNLKFDEVTGIEQLELDNDDTPIYDLSGRIVNRPLKRGIYVKNGYKFIVK